MLQDVVNPPEQLPIEEISSPLSAQIFDFCDPELFQETLQNSEVASNSNCCYEENSSYAPNLSFDPGDINKSSDTSHKNYPQNPVESSTNNNLSAIFDSPEDQIDNDISASIDYSSFLPNQQDQLNLFSLQSYGIPEYSSPDQNAIVPFMGPQMASIFEDECLTLVPPYMRLNTLSSSPPCSFLESANIGAYLEGNSGIFNGSASMYVGNELQSKELDYQGDNNSGIFCSEALPSIFNSNEMQSIGSESSQHVVTGGGGGSSTPLASDVPSLEDSAFKVGKLSVEERKIKIHRYIKKRNERNFSKKIKYACRKTLADSRPRVRGRFAKNDELGEAVRAACSNHSDDTDEDSLHVAVKEEDMLDSSDIFSHISRVNSFDYPIQSWIN
ncbi:hypothetical protein NMG60_11031922 [Bertholletia excelsa]